MVCRLNPIFGGEISFLILKSQLFGELRSPSLKELLLRGGRWNSPAPPELNRKWLLTHIQPILTHIDPNINYKFVHFFGWEYELMS